MKRSISVIAILLILSLTACSIQKTPSRDTGDASNSQSEGIIRLDEGEWPVNEYTEGLPVPTGTVAWAMLDTDHGNCSISISGIEKNDYKTKIKRPSHSYERKKDRRLSGTNR